MTMERPAWTFCFIFIAALVVPGIIFWHYSLGEIAEPIKELEKNLVKGFNEVLKFEDLETDAKSIKTESSNVVDKCALVAASHCTASSPIPGGRRLNTTANTTTPTTYNPSTVVNTQTENTKITNLFTKSLDKVQEVSNDKYFGIDDFKKTADSLNTITDTLKKVPARSPCSLVVPAYCDIYLGADEIVKGITEVNDAINDFTNSDIISTFNDYAGYIDLLNLLPYILVVALLCFFVFWWCGALCCCHRGHRLAGFLFIPFSLFWLISFVIYLVIFAIGTALPIALKDVKATMLKGDPTAEAVIDHIQTKYPEFWKVVFADLEAGALLMYWSSMFMLACALLLLGYSFCICICRPYAPEEDKGKN